VPKNSFIGNIDVVANRLPMSALLVDLLLITLFAIQHSVMARPAFKRWLTDAVPEAAVRGTFMLATAIVTFALISLWQPIATPVWRVENNTLYHGLLALGLAGWALVFYATFLINHFDLFGLRQVWLYFRCKPYTPLAFKVHSLYRFIRHPIMTGVFIGIWVTPVMTVGHIVFALGMSLYILIGVYYEEKDLVKAFGKNYLDYMQTTSKFFPFATIGNRRKNATTVKPEAEELL
jgi:protein-S-isoprenylcysteine O-methyltransferase Ste14